MNPITINITNLVGTIVVIGDKECASAQLQENVLDALSKVLAIARNLETQESCSDKVLSKPIDFENQG